MSVTTNTSSSTHHQNTSELIAKVDTLVEQSWNARGVNIQASEKYAREALDISLQIPYPRGEAFALTHIAFSEYYRYGQLKQALATVQQAVDIFEALQDNEGLASALGVMGSIYRAAGDFNRGFQLIVKATSLNFEANRERWQAWGFYLLGDFYLELQNYREAKKYLQQAFEAAKAVDDGVGQASSLIGKGIALFQLESIPRRR
jgi:tetratricopeptide (TPR) repeat protein